MNNIPKLVMGLFSLNPLFVIAEKNSHFMMGRDKEKEEEPSRVSL